MKKTVPYCKKPIILFLASTLAIGLTLIVVMGFSVNQANAGTCQLPSAPPKVTVKIKQGRLKFDLKKSSHQLKILQTRKDKQSSKSGNKIIIRGLTTMELNYHTSFKYQFQKFGPTSYCVRATEVEARLGYDEIMVYVAKKYRRGSCQYNAIMKHEMRHVSANREGLNRYKKRIVAEIKKAAATMKPIYAKSTKIAENLLQFKLNQSPLKVFNKINKTMTMSNNAIDTAKSYKKVSRMCQNW